MKKSITVKDDVLGWLASSQSDDAANYASRGRIYGGLSNEKLSAHWVESFRKIASDIGNLNARAVNADLKSEFDLRSMEPPYDLVRDEFDAIMTAAAAVLDELRDEDPLRYQEIENEVQRDLDAFKKTRDDSKS